MPGGGSAHRGARAVVLVEQPLPLRDATDADGKLTLVLAAQVPRSDGSTRKFRNIEMAAACNAMDMSIVRLRFVASGFFAFASSKALFLLHGTLA